MKLTLFGRGYKIGGDVKSEMQLFHVNVILNFVNSRIVFCRAHHQPVDFRKTPRQVAGPVEGEGEKRE